jgi:hypothetical protein
VSPRRLLSLVGYSLVLRRIVVVVLTSCVALECEIPGTCIVTKQGPFDFLAQPDSYHEMKVKSEVYK